LLGPLLLSRLLPPSLVAPAQTTDYTSGCRTNGSAFPCFTRKRPDGKTPQGAAGSSP
jgi:hypothetical protein